MTTEEQLLELLKTANRYDIMFNYATNTNNGYKLSIQGKSLNDVMFLYGKLYSYLTSNKIPFKLATQKRIEHINKEQAHKVMTIYMPTEMDIYELAEEVYKKIIGYKGWYDVKDPKGYEFYAGGIYIRNDRDAYGNYIPANKL